MSLTFIQCSCGMEERLNRYPGLEAPPGWQVCSTTDNDGVRHIVTLHCPQCARAEADASVQKEVDMSNPDSNSQIDRRFYPREFIAQRLSPEYGHDWELVGKGHFPQGIPSISGPLMYNVYLVRDKQTGQQELVGRGELERYCKVSPPDQGTTQ